MKNRNYLLIILLLLFSCNYAYADIQPVEVTNPITINPPSIPMPPTNVNVSGITDNSATISFSPVVTANQYSVWVNGTRWTGADSPGVMMRGLQPHTLYDVYITAANDSGESEPSESTSFTTLPPVPTAPAMPSVTNVTGNSALVQWEPLPGWQYIQGYRVYVDGTVVADVNPQAGIQVANLTNLPTGNHVVSISGINANREGPASAPVQFSTRIIAAITGLKMTNHSTDKVWLCWDNITDARNYLVGYNSQVIGETGQTNYAISGLQPNQIYQITVTAVMADGNTSQAATLQAETLPTVPPYTKETLMQTIYSYVPDMMPGLTALFVVGVAFSLARLTKVAIGVRIFRYWR